METTENTNTFGARAKLDVAGRSFEIFRLDALADRFDVAGLPFSLKILLENLLRHEDGVAVSAADVDALAGWDPSAEPDREIAFSPARILMQDFTGVPAITDLAAMADAMADMGGRPELVDPLIPADLVIDHSIVADVSGMPEAFIRNGELEFTRNQERYEFLRWGQGAFAGLRVVPPNTGICHQVNLEYLARVVFTDDETGRAYPDTLVGTDSHTPMVNGLGVLGWGVGGIEAEAAMLGQPISMLVPRVVGFKLTGSLPEGSTATDLVLTVTETLRRHGVVGKFVEFYGDGVATVPVENRATIGNMSPEYGSTCAIFPIDAETLRYLRFTGRPAELVELVERYAKEQGLWHDERSPEPRYSEVLELDLSQVVPSLAGPKRPQDRVPLHRAKAAFATAVVDAVPDRAAPVTSAAPPGREGPQAAERKPGVPPNAPPDDVTKVSPDEASSESFPASDPPAAMAYSSGHNVDGDPAPVAECDEPPCDDRPHRRVPVRLEGGEEVELDHGHVVIAAITSCTNTSNPSVMLAAGLLARNLVERGLVAKPWVKTSLAPGSKVVLDYYSRAGLMPYLEKLGFYLVGFGCTTCIGNSGPLLPGVAEAVDEQGLAVCSVLSGNRNFEGRIHPSVRMNYLASPPLVVAYAVAGTMDIDLITEPLGAGSDGNPVYLRDVWPSTEELERVLDESVRSEVFARNYEDVFSGDERWRNLPVPSGSRFTWDPDSTYIRRPPFFDGIPAEPIPPGAVTQARVLAVLGDSVTTDHISPAGVIRRDSPAGRWLIEHGVDAVDFNSYGSRRGNFEVMVRGTFASPRIRNRLVPGVEGGVTRHLPSGEQTSIYDAAMRYREEATPLVILAGKDYGSGSSRDWAAKGTALLGVRAVIAESFERIHRSNLVGMGILPLQFAPGESVESLGLTGEETFEIPDLDASGGDGPLPETVEIRAGNRTFTARVRIDTPKEADYYRHGGILQYVLRRLRG